MHKKGQNSIFGSMFDKPVQNSIWGQPGQQLFQNQAQGLNESKNKSQFDSGGLFGSGANSRGIETGFGDFGGLFGTKTQKTTQNHSESVFQARSEITQKIDHTVKTSTTNTTSAQRDSIFAESKPVVMIKSVLSQIQEKQENEISAKNADLTALQAQLNEIELRKGDLNQELGDLRKEVTGYQGSNQTLKIRISELEQVLEQYKSLESTANLEKQSLIDHNTETLRLLEEANREIEARDSKINQLEARLRNSEVYMELNKQKFGGLVLKKLTEFGLGEKLTEFQESNLSTNSAFYRFLIDLLDQKFGAKNRDLEEAVRLKIQQYDSLVEKNEGLGKDLEHLRAEYQNLTKTVGVASKPKVLIF